MKVIMFPDAEITVASLTSLHDLALDFLYFLFVFLSLEANI